jgi:anti-anti-sigma regulatory factor
MEPLHCARGIERPIDAESAIALTREGLESGMTHVIIDLENVREVWTALLGCYIVIAKEADIAGGRVILAGPTPRIRALIEAVNLDRIFGLADTVSDALTAVEDQ